MTLNGVMALFCVISANSGSFRAHCVKVHVRYLISWWVLVQSRRLIVPTGLSSMFILCRPSCIWRTDGRLSALAHHPLGTHFSRSLKIAFVNELLNETSNFLILFLLAHAARCQFCLVNVYEFTVVVMSNRERIATISYTATVGLFTSNV